MTVNLLNSGFKSIEDNFAKMCKISYFVESVGSVWDDETTLLNPSGTLIVQGDLIPDATGYYYLAGSNQDLGLAWNNYYSRIQGGYYIFSDQSGLSTLLGSDLNQGGTGASGTWANNLLGIYAGSFFPNSGVSGIAVITNNPLVDNWVSGIVLPMDTREGSKESVLMQEGRLKNDDLKLFVSGNTNFTGSDRVVKVQLGSPTGDQYTVIPKGVIQYESQGTSIFRKVYLRKLTNGSLIGE